MRPEKRIAVSMNGVRKSFGEEPNRIEVLRGVELEAHAGEILLLVGPSGCGKTTLLCIMAGLLDADDGHVSVFGQPIQSLTAPQKTDFRAANVGFVFQQFNLIPALTVVENAAVPLLIRQIPRAQALDQAAAMLEQVGLKHRLQARPAKLSGGGQQRVAIARALVANPRLLICDEPTASLDGETGGKVMEILRHTSLSAGRCVIVVTHDNRIFHYGDRIAHVLDGRISSVEVVRKSKYEKAVLLLSA